MNDFKRFESVRTVTRKPGSRCWWIKITAMFALLLCVGIAGSVYLFLDAKSEQNHAIAAEFRRTVEDRIQLVQAGFDAYTTGLQQLATSLSRDSRFGTYPTYEEFLYQAKAFNESYPGVMLIALVLNVTDERRPAYEDFMSTQDVRNKRILEPSFFKAPAANRSSYLPVPYLLFSPVLDPLYSDRIPNMDVLPIPSFGDSLLLTTKMGMCGVNRIKSLADDLRLFDLFCPFRSSNFSEETPDGRALSFFGGVAMFFTGDSIVRSLAFETSTSEILMVVDDTRPAWGGIDVPGLPLVLDDSTRIVAVTSRKVAGVSVTVNVDDVTAANILQKAGRLVIAKNLTFTNREYQVTVAALPEFTSSRSTNSPQVVLGYSLATAGVLIILFALMGFYQYKRDIATTQAELDRRRQRAQVVNAAKEAHEKTIAYACHQLRNPLQSIVGSISFLKEQFANNESCREDITAIAGAASDMSRVIDDISDWVKVSVGQLELKLEPVSLKSLLEDVVDKHMEYVKPGKVSLSSAVHVSCRSLYFVLDPGRVKQVLTNAVMNSIRATESGSILLSVEPEDGISPVADSLCKLTFKVVDTGCGFGKLDPLRLFYPQHGALSANATPPLSGAAKPGPTLRHRPSKSSTILSQFMGTMLSRERSQSKSPPTTPDGRSAGFRMSSSRKVMPSEDASEETHVVPIRPAVSMSRYRPPQRTVLSAVLEAPTDNDADGDLAGIGLGLPMAKQIVDMMHGSISLSRVENSSTVLAFTIPSTCVSSLITTASRRYRLEHDVSVNSDSSSVRGGAVSSSVLDALRATVTSSPRVTQLSGQGNVAVSVESFDEKPQSRDNQYRGNTLSAGDVVVPVDAANAAVPDIGLSPICNPSSRRENVIERVCNPVSISEEPDGVPGENFTHDPILSGHSREGGASPGATAVIPSGFSSVGIDTIPISRESPDAAVGGVVSAAGLAANKGQATPKLQPLILPLSSSILQPGQELAGMRVLVVDDERAIRRLCQRMLERLGCTCVLLEDGDQVMDTLLASGYVPKDGAEPTGHIATPFQPFHAVLMDIMMVRSNGVDVVVEVRSRFENTPAPTPSPTRARAGSAEAFSPAVPSQCRLPPFIAMTANTSLADITNYKRAGFVNVLGKPFDLSALRTKLLVYRQIV